METEKSHSPGEARKNSSAKKSGKSHKGKDQQDDAAQDTGEAGLSAPQTDEGSMGLRGDRAEDLQSIANRETAPSDFQADPSDDGPQRNATILNAQGEPFHAATQGQPLPILDAQGHVAASDLMGEEAPAGLQVDSAATFADSATADQEAAATAAQLQVDQAASADQSPGADPTNDEIWVLETVVVASTEPETSIRSPDELVIFDGEPRPDLASTEIPLDLIVAMQTDGGLNQSSAAAEEDASQRSFFHGSRGVRIPVHRHSNAQSEHPQSRRDIWHVGQDTWNAVYKNAKVTAEQVDRSVKRKPYTYVLGAMGVGIAIAAALL